MAHVLATMLASRGGEAFVYCATCGAVILTWDALVERRAAVPNWAQLEDLNGKELHDDS